MVCFGILLMFCQDPKPPPAPPPVARFCKVAKPFEWSRHDTARSQQQARAINAAGVKICGWKPPAKAKK